MNNNSKLNVSYDRLVFNDLYYRFHTSGSVYDLVKGSLINSIVDSLNEFISEKLEGLFIDSFYVSLSISLRENLNEE